MISRTFFTRMANGTPAEEGEGRPGLLIVDDCSIICSLLNMVLTQSGFRVILASSGPQALEKFRRHGSDIQLVLCDIAMRPWDGRETMSRLKELQPALVYCYMSGAGSDYTTPELIAEGARSVFNKPLALPDLVDALAGFARERAAVPNVSASV